MDEGEIAAIAVNGCYDAHMADARAIAATAKEYQIAGLKLTAFYTLTVVELMTATTSKLIA